MSKLCTAPSNLDVEIKCTNRQTIAIGLGYVVELNPKRLRCKHVSLTLEKLLNEQHMTYGPNYILSDFIY